MRHSIRFWLYFIIAIVLATYFAVRITMIGMGHGPMSHIRNISVSADQNNKDLSRLINAAGIVPGTRATGDNLIQINERINAVPGVKNSATKRRPNGNLDIRVELYRAVALWTDGTNYYPLSADGTIVNQPTDQRGEGAIVFRGTVPSDISEITKQAHNLADDLDYLEWIENRRWNITTTGGITVMLPEKSPDAAIGSLILLNKNHGILAKDIKIIDMRDPARILVK